MKTSQKRAIKRHLELSGKITPAEAYNLYGCMRLSERIREIEKDGHEIRHDRNGKRPNYAIYRWMR